jgi:hypothetical protein
VENQKIQEVLEEKGKAALGAAIRERSQTMFSLFRTHRDQIADPAQEEAQQS